MSSWRNDFETIRILYAFVMRHALDPSRIGNQVGFRALMSRKRRQDFATKSAPCDRIGH
jgi:hypothetical protein